MPIFFKNAKTKATHAGSIFKHHIDKLNPTAIPQACSRTALFNIHNDKTTLSTPTKTVGKIMDKITAPMSKALREKIETGLRNGLIELSDDNNSYQKHYQYQAPEIRTLFRDSTANAINVILFCEDDIADEQIKFCSDKNIKRFLVGPDSTYYQAKLAGFKKQLASEEKQDKQYRNSMEL